jgi:hypothetical protein
MIVVADATPLHYLVLIGYVEVLPESRMRKLQRSQPRGERYRIASDSEFAQKPLNGRLITLFEQIDNVSL